MSIPFYFAMEENEAAPQPGSRCAQLGFGFNADGTLRMPARKIAGAPAVIDDRFLPAKAPASAVLDRLAEACGNGCFLDFERPVSEVGAAIAVGLFRRLKGKMTVPPAWRGLCPDADVQIAGSLCNHWENFIKSIQESCGNRWVLEIVPWRVSVPTNTRNDSGYLDAAVCNYRIENRELLYYDTEGSIGKKLEIAEKYDCRAGITLLREYRQCPQE